MRTIANSLVTTSLVVVAALAAIPARAANLDAASAIDAVTVYPDGASVTRVIMLDLAAGDTTLVAKDFPLALDPRRRSSRSARSMPSRRAPPLRSTSLKSTSASKR